MTDLLGQLTPGTQFRMSTQYPDRKRRPMFRYVLPRDGKRTMSLFAFHGVLTVGEHQTNGTVIVFDENNSMVPMCGQLRIRQ